ncbi:hypothetical protein IRJ41_018230, partial [Triplophysa rosa]
MALVLKQMKQMKVNVIQAFNILLLDGRNRLVTQVDVEAVASVHPNHIGSLLVAPKSRPNHVIIFWHAVAAARRDIITTTPLHVAYEYSYRSGTGRPSAEAGSLTLEQEQMSVS